MWEVSWRRGQTATYWPQVPLYYSSTSSSFYWATQPGSWGPKPSVRHWLPLQHLVLNCDWNSNCDCNSNWTLPVSNSNCNWPKPSVAPGYIIIWRPPASCGRRICTKFNLSTGQGDIFDHMHLFLPLIYVFNWRLGRGSICYIWERYELRLLAIGWIVQVRAFYKDGFSIR